MNNTIMPIEVICIFDIEGNIKPCKIRFQENGENIVIEIESSSKPEVRTFPSLQRIYTCQVIDDGIKKEIKLKFDHGKYPDKCKWYLLP